MLSKSSIIIFFQTNLIRNRINFNKLRKDICVIWNEPNIFFDILQQEANKDNFYPIPQTLKTNTVQQIAH